MLSEVLWSHVTAGPKEAESQWNQTIVENNEILTRAHYMDECARGHEVLGFESSPVVLSVVCDALSFCLVNG